MIRIGGGKGMGYILADDTPPPLQLFAVFAVLPLFEYEIKVCTALVLAMDAVTFHAFL